MSFHIRVYDFFHYMDESEAYDVGSFSTYEDAVIEAKIIVDKCLEESWEKGMSPDAMMSNYYMFGEDPAVLPDGPRSIDRFSATGYARSVVETICAKMGKTGSV